MRWKIRKERVFDHQKRAWTHHFSWTLYITTVRRPVAHYRTWDQCIQHVQRYYSRFGSNA
jgi:hypothetical protein